jgi:hypothetical protein
MKLSRETRLNFLHYSRFVLPFGIAAIFLTVLAVGWYEEPDRLEIGYEPVQPIAYSHKLHAGVMRIPCLYCHSNALKSRHATIPTVAKCMNCHAVTKTESPPIKMIAAIYSSGEPLKWQRIHSLPDYVYFDHRPHVDAGILCQTCHGEVQEMEVVKQHMSLRMGNCLGCHRDPKYALPADSKIYRGSEDCGVCHR